MGANGSALRVGKPIKTKHLEEQAIIKEQLALNSGMKTQTPQSNKKPLRVSFTEADLSSQKDRVSNHYSKPPLSNGAPNQRPASMPSYGTRIKYTEPSQPLSNGHANGNSNSYLSAAHKLDGQINEDSKRSQPTSHHVYRGKKSYVPSHIPPQLRQQQSNSKHIDRQTERKVSSNPNQVHQIVALDAQRRPRYQSYDNTDTTTHQYRVPAPARNRSETEPTTTLTRRQQRARSVSPRRRDRIVVQGNLSRSDLENLKNVIRSAERASNTLRKQQKISGSSESIPANRMTSFVIGRPAKFNPGAYGDMGIFKAISSVNDNLYICGVMALSEEKVKALRINCIINATLEWPAFKIPGLETVKVQVDDVPSASLAPYFDRVADKVHSVISGGGRVLVHCMAGISRSSTLCISYLMKHKGLSLQQAYGLMKTRRPLIRPNDGFWRQLTNYEKELKRRHKSGASSLKEQKSTSGGVSHQNSNENPSLSVRRLTSAARTGPPSLSTNHSSARTGQSSLTTNHIPVRAGLPTQSTNQSSDRRTHENSQSVVNTRYPARGYYSSSSKIPNHSLNMSAGATKNPATHKLGTLRNSAHGTVRLQPNTQRDIALSAMRGSSHWSTTYGSDFSRRPPK